MKIENLSAQFKIRTLHAGDIDAIYSLSCGNEIFYRFHPPFVSRESILEDMKALPAGKSYDDKFYLGFFQEDQLVALMDLILDFPAKGIAFIGLFMVDKKHQGRGLGSDIIRECLTCFRNSGFRSVRLATDKGNPQSNGFWSKNGFRQTEERKECIIREFVL